MRKVGTSRPSGPQEHVRASFPSVMCFCHLRWNFVYQRPHHLMTRFQKLTDVHIWEEPLFEDRVQSELASSIGRGGVRVLTPLLPRDLGSESVASAQRWLLNQYLLEHAIEHFIAWYYTPMAMHFSDHLTPEVTVYDCMDELSAFQNAPEGLAEQERHLFKRADVVFAGGPSLYGSKRNQHGNVHLFPSSIDRAHFGAARSRLTDPRDQTYIPHPRIGFYGVLDERLDRDLLREVAKQHPAWHFVLIGPVVKIRMEELPSACNIHYIGQKDYAELPSYLANWDVAMLPFAQNASTRFISPTKTPEYLAAGKPVASTPIPDVIKPYGEMKLVKIGVDVHGFSDAIEACLHDVNSGWLARVDRFLACTSWDTTFAGMWRNIERCISRDSSYCTTAVGERSGVNV
jgi:glycosyltransferase involved in cell wall biosynthesis